MLLLGVIFMVTATQATLYDSFTGEPVTKTQLQHYEKNNSTFYCVTDVKPCDRDEYRRVDGSCNNLKNPPRGAVHTPSYRVLKPVYGEGIDVGVVRKQTNAYKRPPSPICQCACE